MTLYELTEDMAALLARLEQVDEEDETLEQAIKDTLEMVAMDFADKADGYAKVLRQIQADAESVKAEKLRLAKRQSALENNADRLKEALKKAMEATGQKSLKTELFSFSVRSSQSVEILTDNVFEIPDEYLRYKDPEVDKTKLAAWLKLNPECSFARMATKTSLTVK